MLLEADATGLEVVCAGVLSQCPVLCGELSNEIDVHGANEGMFNGNRLVAKIFFFRLIYGGNEFSYANDPDFNHISRKPAYWKQIIDNFYIKYYGLAQWHERLMFDVMRSGKFTSPTGRQYQFKPDANHNWPRTTILNYPVQGFGADVMSLIRISTFKRIARELPSVLLVNTVHDSIVFDVPNDVDVFAVKKLVEKVFTDFPRNFKAVFKSDFNLPLKCKIKCGPNWKEMKEL